VRGAAVASREAKVAEREAQLASHERDLAQRFKDVALREKAVAAFERQGPPPEYRDRRAVPKAAMVEEKHKRLLGELDARGILVSDLPAEDQPLNAEIFAARRQRDLARAMDLLNDLVKAVASLRVRAGLAFVQVLRPALYALLALSALFTFWSGGPVAGRTLPYWTRSVAPTIFGIFLAIFTFYRFALMRAKKYPAATGLFQVGL